MSRYTGPKLRIIRRLGDLPGLISRNFQSRYYHRNRSPGQHGHRKKRKLKTYTRRLMEKQRLRFNYGISEKQMINYVKLAKKMKGATSLNLLRLLEMRLDNIIFRLGLASTIITARQYVNHGHFNVNGLSVSIPSYHCKPKDIIAIKENSKLKQQLKIKTVPRHILPLYRNRGQVLRIANRSSVFLRINELYVVEFYSRKI